MHPRPLVLLPFAVACAVTILPSQGRRGRRGPPSPVFEVLDIDGDGELSGEEMDEAVRSLRLLDQERVSNSCLVRHGQTASIFLAIFLKIQKKKDCFKKFIDDLGAFANWKSSFIRIIRETGNDAPALTNFWRKSQLLA